MRPARPAAVTPAATSRSREASETSSATIAESPGSSPMPSRKRLASPTSCAWIASVPTASNTPSAGAPPTHAIQAGEMSKRRASPAKRSGGP
jgi:hypothetical protein